jgi:hypothetical protein
VRELGWGVIFLAGVLVVVGQIRHEIVLTLIGAVFLAGLGYCFLAVGLLALVHGSKVRVCSLRMLTQKTAAGGEASACFMGGGFFRLPAVIVRYEMNLATKDGRVIRHIFDPDRLCKGITSFSTPERGAYYSGDSVAARSARVGEGGMNAAGFCVIGIADAVSFADALGFFAVSMPVPEAASAGAARLLVVPNPASEAVNVDIASGGDEKRAGTQNLRTDNLIEHRPYMPGDDPRRINWKLFGHAGDLFVREGEREPPPHSQLLILIDTLVDPLLYTAQKGRAGVDMLCENALALAIEYAESGLDVHFGYTGDPPPQSAAAMSPDSSGSVFVGGIAAELLAYPAALLLPATIPAVMPPSVEFRQCLTEADAAGTASTGGILILALARESSAESGLDLFLKKLAPGRNVRLVFLFDDPQLEAPAQICARLYSQRPGVKATSLSFRH